MWETGENRRRGFQGAPICLLSSPFFCLLSLLLLPFLFIQPPMNASLLLHDSPSFILIFFFFFLLPSKFSCVFRTQMSDEEALRCAVA